MNLFGMNDKSFVCCNIFLDKKWVWKVFLPQENQIGSLSRKINYFSVLMYSLVDIMCQEIESVCFVDGNEFRSTGNKCFTLPEWINKFEYLQLHLKYIIL